MIAYIAVNSEENKLFIQWLNGSGNIYSDVPTEVLKEITVTASVGKFWHANIKDKYESVKVDAPLISIAAPDDHTEGKIIEDDLDYVNL